ncbi:MAG: hypothetical protein RSD36_10955 [Terrisporobacter sp.]
MKRYEIHGSDFHKMGEFMGKLTAEGVKFDVIRINGYFMDVEDDCAEKYENLATEMEFIMKEVAVTEA